MAPKSIQQIEKSPKAFRYDGPVTPLGNSDRMLFPGTSYSDLSVDDPVVKNLIARGVLIAENDAAETVGAEPETGTAN